MTRNILLVISLFVSAIAYAQSLADPHHDGDTVGPRMRTELDNDAVQVVRIRMAPHEKVPMHDVTPRVVVWLTDAHLRATLEDGSVRDEHGTAGQVVWVPAQRHAAENLDDHTVEFVAVIPKGTGPRAQN